MTLSAEQTAAMDGFAVKRMENVVGDVDIVVTSLSKHGKLYRIILIKGGFYK